MYLAVCDDDREALDDVCSLLNIWRAEHGSAMRCKTFQSAVDLLESARRERFTRYLFGCDDAGDGWAGGRPEFMRVHRSYIVNMLQVERLSSAGLRTFQGENLPVSRLSFRQLQEDYMALLFERGRTAR